MLFQIMENYGYETDDTEHYDLDYCLDNEEIEQLVLNPYWYLFKCDKLNCSDVYFISDDPICRGNEDADDQVSMFFKEHMNS